MLLSYLVSKGQGTAQNPNGREPIDPRLRLPRAVMSVDTQSPTQIRKHGPHIPRKKHMKNPKKKAEIALHAMKYGVASTIRHYFKEEGLDLKESTIRGWKKACFSNSSPQVERTLASDNSSENENLPSNESAKSPSKMGKNGKYVNELLDVMLQLVPILRSYACRSTRQPCSVVAFSCTAVCGWVWLPRGCSPVDGGGKLKSVTIPH